MPQENVERARVKNNGPLTEVFPDGSEPVVPAVPAPPPRPTLSSMVAASTATLQAAYESYRREWWPRFAFAVAALLIWGSLWLMLFPTVNLPFPDGHGERHQAIDEHFALLVMVACVLPPLLAWLSYLLINKRAVCQHVRPCMPPTLGAALAESALSTWRYEMGKAQWSLSRAEVFAGMWGMITTVSIVGAIAFLLPPFHQVGAPFQGAHSMVAFAVIGASATSFLLDLARLCLRAANDDASKRMFAEALRTLILSVISTLALMTLSRLIGPDQLRKVLFDTPGVDACLLSLGIGAGIAITGPPAFEWIQARFTSALGINGKRPDGGTPLDALDDIDEADAARLAEEGITSVEALVSTSIPRLFLNTRFSLQRIADWHDFGLLITRVGTASATDLRKRWGIRGAAEIRAIMTDPSQTASAEALRGVFKKVMRVDGDAEAQLAVRQIADDERVAHTDAIRQTLLERDN